MQQDEDRLPIPSEDGGNLVEEPRGGMTDDPLVSTEEGVPYDPPTDRVLSEARGDDGAPDAAGIDPTAAGELERTDNIQLPNSEPPRDDELAADVVEALRASDVLAGDRIRVAADGARVVLRGEVESVDVLDEILGIVGDVRGVEEVVDEVRVNRA
jgi:hypothetical protein